MTKMDFKRDLRYSATTVECSAAPTSSYQQVNRLDHVEKTLVFAIVQVGAAPTDSVGHCHRHLNLTQL